MNVRIGKSQYDSFLKAQGGGCAGCGANPIVRKLCVDHNHKTGFVRGLLCHPCNLAVGLVKDNDLTLERLKNYLKRARLDEFNAALKKQSTNGRARGTKIQEGL